MNRIFGLIVVGFLMGGPVLAQDAGPADLRLAARAAVQAGDLAAADALSRQLLAVVPNDAEALLMQAAVARAQGQWDVVRDLARRAYRAAGSDALRFDAAMMAGQAAAQQKRFNASQIWLRRADQYAPDGAKAQVATAYRQVRAQNPLRVQLQFGVTPSNNVNNGAATTVIEIGGLPFELNDSGQQLSGYEATGGVSLSYRLAENPKQRTDALAEFFGKKVWLDSASKAKAPGVDGSDFDYGAVIGGVRQTRLVWPDLGPSQFTALFGQSWSGGQKQAYWGELRFSQLVNQTDQKAMRFGATFRDERRNDDAFNDNRALGVSVEWLRSNGKGQRTTFGVSARDTRSDSATIDSRAFTLSASRSFGRVGSVEPRLTGSVSTHDFRKWFSTVGGRRDDSLNLKVDVVFPEQSVYGFVPQLTVSGRRVWSNVDIYDRNAVSLSLTAVSRF